jgi:hypothetical protein
MSKLVIVCRVSIGTKHFKDLILRPRLLEAGSSLFCKICLVCIKQIAKGNFEFIVKLLLP